MKISISWVFDHINGDWKKVNIENLANRLSQTTVEIGSFKKISINLEHFLITNVIALETENVILYSKEIKKEIELPKHDGIALGSMYLIIKNGHEFRWAQMSDLGSEKETLIPEIFVSDELQSGKWKESFESQDYILELDNISITHRPDLWGHRGFAREIAAILDLPLLPIENFIARRIINNFEKTYLQSNPNNPFCSSIENPEVCKRFATFYIKQIENKPSCLWMINRLAKVDSKPINTIVDTTNYVMLDLSQPMHAFDAEKIQGKTVNVRLAKKNETLTLLDGELIELTDKDIVIADSQKPVSLAGVMGGKDSQVNQGTKSLVIESANFDAGVIRKSSARFKKRTEASSRFEKSLDPNQNVIAIERLLKLFQDESLPMQLSDSIVSLGKETKEKIINIKHDFIQKKLGVDLQLNFVVKTLKKLEFSIIQKDLSLYEIIVPTFRSTKDVTLPEDIVEEVGRYLCYDNIPFVLPTKPTYTSDLNVVMTERKIKQFFAHSCQMHEAQNYPFYDEQFLREIKWEPGKTIDALSPVSENWKRLVTSLVPHLIKNVQQNLNKSDELRFFESNRIWTPNKDEKQIEKKSLAGIFFSQKKSLDFYQCKEYLNNFFDLFEIQIDWVKAKENLELWYSQYQSANLMHKDKKIGVAGKISSEFLLRIAPGDVTADALAKQDAFAFEIDADFLLSYKPGIKKFKPISKYPAVWVDVSFFIPLKFTVDELTKIISRTDSKIYKVELIDLFVKDEWLDKKSLAFRLHLLDEEKTMTKNEIDQILSRTKKELENIGAQLR